VIKWRAFSNSIVTLVGRVPYSRLSLKASTALDAEKLKALGYKGYVYPLDEKLGLTGLPFKMTLGAMLKVAHESCRSDSYEEAQTRLLDANIDVNDDTIRAVTNSVGELVYTNEKKAADAAYSAFNSGRLSFPTIKIDHILYLEVDGAMVHARKQKGAVEEAKPATEDGQPAKAVTKTDQEDPGKKKKEKKSIWRENKLGVAFATNNILYWMDCHGERQHTIKKRDYVSYIGEASEFSKFMLSLALRNGYGTYKQTVLISDGATWIREMKKMYFPDAQQILDYWHLCHNVSEVAKAVFDMDEDKYKPWADEVCALLKKSKTQEAMATIKRLRPHQVSKTSFNLAQYIENNIENVDYATYQAKGYFIGSGAIESSNKYVIQNRVKLPGMRWNLDSLQYMITLLTKLKSHRWEQDVVEPVYDHYGKTPGIGFTWPGLN
jgi:hypothetical protein